MDTEYLPGLFARPRFTGNAAVSALRRQSFALVWSLLWPLRAYIRCFPVSRGKGFITRRIIAPLLPPPPAGFLIELPNAARLALQFRELLGLTVLLQGGFEVAELDYLGSRIKPGTTFIDVGANVGLYTISMAPLIGAGGRVMAFEPLPANLERLKSNLAMNQFANIDVYGQALGDAEGTVDLKLSNDPCYHSVVEVTENRATGRCETVPVGRLDTVWAAAGFPRVSAIKIDVEGAELMVLKGAEQLIRNCQPYLQLEASTPVHLGALTQWLTPRGYVYQHPPGFMRWNHGFIHRGV